MKPHRTAYSNKRFSLPGGTEANDLWVQVAVEDGQPVLISVWEPTPEERRAIADGANLELTVWGTGTPPVALRTTTVALEGDA